MKLDNMTTDEIISIFGGRQILPQVGKIFPIYAKYCTANYAFFLKDPHHLGTSHTSIRTSHRNQARVMPTCDDQLFLKRYE